MNQDRKRWAGTPTLQNAELLLHASKAAVAMHYAKLLLWEIRLQLTGQPGLARSAPGRKIAIDAFWCKMVMKNAPCRAGAAGAARPFMNDAEV
jgi:hypothetical protein